MRRRKVLEKTVRSVIEQLESRTLLSGSLLTVGTGTASISGTVFGDTNVDGVMNNGEVGIAGATTFLDLNGNGKPDANEPSLTTDANGAFTFASIGAGFYHVIVVPQAGLVQSYPGNYQVSVHDGAAATVQIGEIANPVFNPTFSLGDTGFVTSLSSSSTDTGPGTYTVSVDPINFNASAASFGDHTTGTGQMMIIDGSATANTVDWQETVTLTPSTTYDFTGWAASWGNGATGADPAPANLQIIVDSNVVGSLTLSATDGQFTQFTGQFTSVAGGTAVLQVADANASSHFVLDDFAVVRPTSGSVNGVVFNDNNQDGLYDPPTEDFLSGDTIFMDLNGNGILDAGEPSTVTNNVGFYSFTIVPGSYELVVIPRTNFHQDPPGYLQVPITPNTQTLVNVGENNRTTISGIVYQDLNGNGVQDVNEPPVAGETAFIDENLNGTLEPGVLNASTGQFENGEPFSVTDATGRFTFTGLDPGEYRLVIQSAQNLIQDNPGYIDVIVNPSQNLVQNLGEGLPASITGTVFNDKNANGVQDPGEIGLIDQDVFADINGNGVFDANGVDANGRPQLPEPSSVTAADGTYLLNNLGPGTYTVRVIDPPGALVTAPLNVAHSYTVTLASGENVTGDNFGFKTPDLTITTVSYPTAPTLTNVRKHAVFRITNVGSLPANGLVGLTLYASTTVPLDTGTATIVATIPGRKVHLLPGQSRLYRLTFEYPTQLPLNEYFITAQVNSTVQDNNISNNLTAAIGPVQIGPPFIDLSLAYAAQPLPQVAPGDTSVLSLLVANNGNVTSTNGMSFRVYASGTDQLEPNETPLETIAVHGKIRPGHSKIYKVAVPYPGPNIGNRFLIVAVDSGDPLGEMNLANNVVLPLAVTYFQ